MDREAPNRSDDCLPAESLRTMLQIPLTAALVLGFFIVGAAADAAAQGATLVVEQPKVFPAEFNGDLSLLPRTPLGTGEPRPYRPRLSGPPPAPSKLEASMQAASV